MLKNIDTAMRRAGRAPERQTPIPADIPVLIVGGGPAGLLSSILLGRFGVPNLLVEKHPSTSMFPKARRLNARTMEILRVLGIEGDVRAKEQRVDDLPLMLGGETLRDPVRLRIDGDRRDDMYRYSPTTWAFIPQDDVEPILRSHAERQHLSDVRFGLEVIGVDQDSEGVMVSVRDPRSGREYSTRARYLIAADGAHSFVREALGITMSGSEHLARELNVLFQADLEPVRGANRSVLFQVRNDDIDAVIGMAGERRWIMLCAEFPEATPERCAALVRSAAGAPELAVEIEAINRWERAAAVADQFRVGRVFLVGDAAHRLTPAGAFGLNTGVQDAHNLAWKLGAVFGDWAGEALLDTYALERHEVARANVELSRRFWDKGLGAAVGYVFGFSYERGAIVSDGTDLPRVDDPVSQYVPTARPGGRVPHWWLSSGGGTVSSLDIADREFVLITDERGGSWTSAVEVEAATGMPIRAVVEHGPAWRALCGLEPGGALLLRPDGHVAWRARRSTTGAIAAGEELHLVLDRILGNAASGPERAIETAALGAA